MSSKSKEIVSYFGKCRCCLTYSYLKNMWTEYYRHGKKEIYAEMLEQCYGFSFDQSIQAEQEQICETCIKKLRDALAFRNLVIESNSQLLQKADNDIADKVKVEILEEDDIMDGYNIEITYDDEDWKLEGGKIEPDDESNDMQPSEELEEGQVDESAQEKGEHQEFEEEHDKNNEIDEHGAVAGEETYEDVEFLEEDMEVNTSNVTKKNEDKDKGTRKWPKKLPRVDRNRKYKQYTQEELIMCIESIRNGAMSAAEAADYFNIPRKTVTKKLTNYVEKDEKKDQIYKFYKEIKSVLSFTNATPYKTTIVKYSCIYCLKAVFTDPEELRNHTRTQHIDERTKKVDIFMRPQWENEILKLDIYNLLCIVCCESIPEWNDMLQHLSVVHKVHLDYAYSRIIPYILEPDLKCALCKAPFSNFLQLDGHMNSHYENYVCSDCGDYFLTQTRLKAHQKTHEDGRYPCEICNKVFTQMKYKRKHVKLVHNHTMKFKCSYCVEIFPSEVSRQNHLQDKHMEKIKPITCELCGKVFYWRQYYTAHKKKRHGEKTHECKVCGKKFSRNYQLQEHLIGHTKVKSVECPICHNKYMTKSSMRVHLMNQHRRKEQVYQIVTES